MMFLDDFFWRAIIAGIGVALVAGPLGCFVVWRRMAYLGDTMAHSSLLGVALGFLLHIDLTFAVFAIASIVAIVLFIFQRQKQLASDAVLGTLSHATLALGVLVISLMTWLRVDIMSYLFGDILSVNTTDIIIIYLASFSILLILLKIWKPLLAITVNEDLARTEGISCVRIQLVFMLLIAAMIALSLKIIGMLLVTALLIIPATAARRFSKTPEQMAITASALGIVSVIIGLFSSLEYDTPSGPSIVMVMVILFFVSYLLPAPKGYTLR